MVENTRETWQDFKATKLPAEMEELFKVRTEEEKLIEDVKASQVKLLREIIDNFGSYYGCSLYNKVFRGDRGGYDRATDLIREQIRNNIVKYRSLYGDDKRIEALTHAYFNLENKEKNDAKPPRF